MMRSHVLILVGGAAVGLASLAVYGGAFRRGEALEGSGTIEARNVRVGSKVGGRVSAVRVREGATVLAGQVLVTFDNQELLAGLEQARANLEKMQRGSRPEDIAEARAAAAQARADYELRRNGSRKEDIEAARAEVDRTRVDAGHAERNFRRVADITRGIILRGAGMANLWSDGLILLGMGMGLMLLAAKRFRKKVIAV